MNKLRKAFFETKMTWPRVIILSLVTALMTAVLNCIPLLSDTSFAAPAEMFEFWVLAALFIIFNCHGYLEASVKTFVFFLISQPLIFLLEVPFKDAGWGLFIYYPRWFIFTILTIPGAIIAYYAKREGWISGVIMSVANILVLYCGSTKINYFISHFPHYLLTLIFCVVTVVFYTLFLLKGKKAKTVAAVITSVVVIVYLMLPLLNISTGKSYCDYPLEEGTWELVSVSDENLTVSLSEESIYLESETGGEYTVVVQNQDGEQLLYNIVFDKKTGAFDIQISDIN